MERNKSKKGITLIALIITIIVMLILVAVSVQIVINSGLFDSAKTAAKKTEGAYRAEGAEGSKVNIDGEIYNSMEEYMERSCTHEWGECQITKEANCTETGSKKATCTKCGKEKTEEIAIDETAHNYVNYICTRCRAEDPNKPIEAGQYIKYDVAYTDVYMSSYNYTATNGWRLLHATQNKNPDGTFNGTYREVELISTGIPAQFYYDYNNSGTWWETNSSILTTFKNLLGGTSYKFYINGAECESLKAAAGFYYNFGSLPFTVTSSPSYNNGGYTAITNSDQKSGTTAGTGAGLFLTNKATSVRLLTLKELNEARGITNDPDNTGTISAVQDPTGLYYLRNLKSVTGIGTTRYTTGYYWLASPWPGNYDSVAYVYYDGNLGTNGNAPGGVRPVVKISRV